MKNKSVKRELNPIQQSLFSKLKDIMLVDQRRLSARIHGIEKLKAKRLNKPLLLKFSCRLNRLNYV